MDHHKSLNVSPWNVDISHMLRARRVTAVRWKFFFVNFSFHSHFIKLDMLVRATTMMRNMLKFIAVNGDSDDCDDCSVRRASGSSLVSARYFELCVRLIDSSKCKCADYWHKQKKLMSEQLPILYGWGSFVRQHMHVMHETRTLID